MVTGAGPGKTTVADGAGRGAVFVALEGGGAKGVAHLGVLEAILERHFDVRGICGTSAGAIIAALHAAGYAPKDIVAEDGSRTILADLDPPLRSATDLLGGGWPAIRALRAIWRRPFWRYGTLAGLGVAFVGPWAVAAQTGSMWVGLASSVVLLCLAVCGFLRFLNGLARIDAFRRRLDELLGRKIGLPRFERVSFHALARAGKGPLKIVATNVSTGSMQLFSLQRSPDTAIADAVSASIAIPFVFHAHRIGSDHFVDGGLVSNLPAWSFDDERALHPGIRAINVEIDALDGADPRWGLRPSWLRLGQVRYVERLFRTAVFGRGELNTRVTGRAINLKIPVPDSVLGVLDFDANLATIQLVRRNARLTAGAQLDFDIGLDTAARRICEAAASLLKGPGSDGRPVALRASIAVMRRRDVQLVQDWRGDRFDPGDLYEVGARLTYRASTAAGPDPETILPLGIPVIADALCRDAVVFQNLTDLNEADEDARSRALRSRLGAEVKWLCAVPILPEAFGTRDRDGDEARRLLVLVEGLEEIDVRTDDYLQTLGLLSDRIYIILSQLLNPVPGEQNAGKSEVHRA